MKVSDQLSEDLHKYENSMKHEIYKVCGVFEKEQRIFAFPYKLISNSVSWNSKQNVIDQAAILYKKKQRNHKISLDFSSVWSYRSYTILEDGILELELGERSAHRRLKIPFYVHEYQMAKLRKGTCKDMTIKKRDKNWFAFVLVEIPKENSPGDLIMGVDIGIKNPAVAYTSDNDIKFFGNGRQLRFLNCSYRKKISEMQRRHQYKKLRTFDHKLSRILTNSDHQISRQIIDFAVSHNVGIIKLEKLKGIHNQFDVSISPRMYLWSYQRLQHFIAYKAELSGIDIQHVNPYNTSKKCPNCGKINIPKGRSYMCSCGFTAHRDIVGAQNIMLAL